MSLLRPSLTNTYGPKRHVAAFHELLVGGERILVVGGGPEGKGIGKLASDESLDLIETDIVPGMRTQILCDGHDLPFNSGMFDAAVAQSVLEHVVDPPRVVAEMHRILKAEGLVYASIPFMLPMHGWIDYTRYTPLGFRNLFRWFDEVDAGVQVGPGSALAWMVRYLTTACVPAGAAKLGRVVGTYSGLWFKYLDVLARGNRAAALEAAHGLYFIGRRRVRLVAPCAHLSPMPDPSVGGSNRARHLRATTT